MSKHVIVYSHGFGVRKDDRGLFTDIAKAFPWAEHLMFDYCQADESMNTLTVLSLQDQAQKLTNKLNDVKGDSIVDIVAHSQGCLVTALASPKNIRSIIFLSPPDNMERDRLAEYFGSFKGSNINLQGQSTLKRRDGSTTIVPAEYWEGLEGIDVIALYNNLANLAKVTFFVANTDEVLGKTNFIELDKRIKVVRLPGNHDFSGEFRKPMIDGLIN